MSKIVLWHVLELFETILFIPYTVLVFSDKIFACVSELFTKDFRPKKESNSSKTFRYSCYLFKLNWPPVLITLHTPPQPVSHASVLVVKEGLPLVISIWNVCTPPLKVRTSLFQQCHTGRTLVWFNCRYFLPFQISIMTTPYFTPGKLDTIVPITWATLLIDCALWRRRSLQASCSEFFFSVVNFTVLFTEFIYNPKNISVCYSSRKDFVGWIVKPRYCKRFMQASMFLQQS